MKAVHVDGAKQEITFEDGSKMTYKEFQNQGVVIPKPKKPKKKKKVENESRD